MLGSTFIWSLFFALPFLLSPLPSDYLFCSACFCSLILSACHYLSHIYPHCIIHYQHSTSTFANSHPHPQSLQEWELVKTPINPFTAHYIRPVHNLIYTTHLSLQISLTDVSDFVSARLSFDNGCHIERMGVNACLDEEPIHRWCRDYSPFAKMKREYY